LVGLSAFALSGCETMGSKEGAGTIFGGAVGAGVGSLFGRGSGKTVAIIGGGVAGAFLGNAIGRRMDENDRRRVAEALEKNGPGQPTSWKNESTGVQHTVTPQDTFVRDGQQCRTFVQEAVVNGAPQKISGTACRRPDGANWDVT
jgi:surface antigen